MSPPSNCTRRRSRGSIGSFHTFKLRFLMALQRSARAGIAVKDVYLWVQPQR